VVPVHYRQKKPTISDWPALRLKEEDLGKHFNGGPMNLGIILGDDYGTADIDLDCLEAVRAAAHFLPGTGMRFGRRSKPSSHYFYRADPPIETRKFLDKDRKTILELRCKKRDGETGMQTVVPPSVHESGEEIRFEPNCGPTPQNVDADVLSKAVSRTAAAALLAKHWPKSGEGRHTTMLALAGGLARSGWGEPEVKVFCNATYLSLADPDRSKLQRIDSEIESTFQRFTEGGEFTGWPHLMQAIGDSTVTLVTKWLGIDPLKQGSRADWRAALIVNDHGGPRPLLANAIMALREAPEWAGVLAFNEFSVGTTALKPPPWIGATPGEWTDQEDRLTANWLQHAGIFVSVEIAGQAVQAAAKDRRFHPIQQYLDNLKWDGTKRIDTWLSRYLGADPTEYTAAVGRRWVISGVARIYKPGAKADCCLILEGPQGQKKSSALHTIAGEWFTDEIADLGSKDAAMQTRGVWIIEIAELDSMSRGEVSKIKAFMSRTTDRFRPPYGKRLIESPRQCVFAGSVNHSSYLRDESGGRRFWPVRCGSINLKDLAADRDQLWAEAVVWYRADSPWWLESIELNRQAEKEQEDRYEGDPWDEVIAAWLESPRERYDEKGHPVGPFASTAESVSITDILAHGIGKRQDQWSQSDKNRVARSLRSLRWERYRAREGETREWRYRRESQ